MGLVFKIEANSISKDDDMTYYNHIYWDVTKQNILGFSKIVEIYNDVSEHPRYEFGNIVDGKFVSVAGGEGDPIDNDEIGCGGVYFEVDVYWYNNICKY